MPLRDMANQSVGNFPPARERQSFVRQALVPTIVVVSLALSACSSNAAPRTPSSSSFAACDAFVAQQGQPNGVFESPAFGSNLLMQVGGQQPVLLVGSDDLPWYAPRIVSGSGVVSVSNPVGGYPADCRYSAVLVALCPGKAQLVAGTYVPPGSERPAMEWFVTITVRP